MCYEMFVIFWRKVEKVVDNNARFEEKINFKLKIACTNKCKIQSFDFAS